MNVPRWTVMSSVVLGPPEVLGKFLRVHTLWRSRGVYYQEYTMRFIKAFARSDRLYK